LKKFAAPALAAVLSLAFSGSAFAASYQQISGAIVNPIQTIFGGDHSYVGVDLEPVAFLFAADLFAADLFSASLSGADLSNALLSDADLSNADLTLADLLDADLLDAILLDADLTLADLTGADLTGAFLLGADLSFADLSGADLSGAVGLDTTAGDAMYNANTDFTNTNFDPVAAGWEFVPEPTSLAMLSLGGLLLTRRRRG